MFSGTFIRVLWKAQPPKRAGRAPGGLAAEDHRVLPNERGLDVVHKGEVERPCVEHGGGVRHVAGGGRPLQDQPGTGQIPRTLLFHAHVCFSRSIYGYLE